MNILDLQMQAWEIAEIKGHHESWSGVSARAHALARLALVHTEVSEAAQEIKRHGLTLAAKRRVSHELADVFIRIADFAEELGLDLDEAVGQVLEQNRLRPYRYGTPEEESIS